VHHLARAKRDFQTAHADDRVQNRTAA
jgi:hypothetical protein